MFCQLLLRRKINILAFENKWLILIANFFEIDIFGNSFKKAISSKFYEIINLYTHLFVWLHKKIFFSSAFSYENVCSSQHESSDSYSSFPVLFLAFFLSIIDVRLK